MNLWPESENDPMALAWSEAVMKGIHASSDTILPASLKATQRDRHGLKIPHIGVQNHKVIELGIVNCQDSFCCSLSAQLFAYSKSSIFIQGIEINRLRRNLARIPFLELSLLSRLS